MRTYLLERVLSLVPMLIGVTIVAFLMMWLIPGTVVNQLIETERRADESTKAAIRAVCGLDQPLYVQYGRWVVGIPRGHLGQGWRFGLPVGKMIADRLAVTAELELLVLLVALPVGTQLETLSAVRKNTPLNHVARVANLFSSLGMTIRGRSPARRSRRLPPTTVRAHATNEIAH